MSELITQHRMPATAVVQIEAISDILAAGGAIPIPGTDIALTGVDIKFDTEHFLHDGIYSRTIHVPAGFMLCGSLIRLPTILTLSGDMSLYDGAQWNRLSGYHVLACSANRRGMGFAHELTHATMLFATRAKNVKDAEQEFTEEWERLMPAKEV